MRGSTLDKYPNHVQIEYRLLKALEPYMSNIDVYKQYGDTTYSIPLSNGTQRARIKVEIVEIVFCTECKLEVINPNYNQKTHEKCPVNAKNVVSEEYDPDAGKPGIDFALTKKGVEMIITPDTRPIEHS